MTTLYLNVQSDHDGVITDRAKPVTRACSFVAWRATRCMRVDGTTVCVNMFLSGSSVLYSVVLQARVLNDWFACIG